jgi:hypothetical protein
MLRVQCLRSLSSKFNVLNSMRVALGVNRTDILRKA